jgi:hypothetical protein
MSSNGPSEITAKASRERPDGGFRGLLHAAALTAVVAGALGSVGLMLWVGHRNPSRVLLGLFAIWVLSPFVALLLANMVSKHWSVITRAALYSVMLILTLSSLAFYGDVVWRPRPQPAFVFLVVPLGSWLFMMIVVSIAALISVRLSRRGAKPLK